MPASAVLNVFSTPYSCTSGIAVGDWVYVSAANTVAKADADNALMPAIGVVVKKPTTTTCVVQLAGEYAPAIAPSFTPGSAQYISATAGAITESTAGLTIIQQVGVARSATAMTLATATLVGGQSISGNLTVSGDVTVGDDLAVIGDSGFFGVAPVAQPANTVDARHAMVTLGLIATGGNGLANALRLPLFDARDADYTVIDTTGGVGLFSLEGAVGTETHLLGEAAQNNTKTDICLMEVVLPADYIAAANVTLTVNLHRVVAGGTTLTTTIDAEVFLMADDGTAGADICATAAITYTDVAAADKTFTITGTTLTPGCRLLVRLTAVATEAGNTGTVTARINSVRVS